METRHFLLKPGTLSPNNQQLPVILHKSVIDVDAQDSSASAFEQLFENNGWPADWRDTVFPYEHYHSTAHEVLGIASGWARLELGGSTGREMLLKAGDVLILPGGTGHRCLEASQDFLAVGAYPAGARWDNCRQTADTPTLERISSLEIPDADPAWGSHGPLVALWSSVR